MPSRIEKGMYWQRAWSLVEGCTPVSPGCEHCWSAAQTHMRAQQKKPAMRARYGGLTTPAGKWNGRIRLQYDSLKLPLTVKKPTVWAIWNDLFHRDVPHYFIDRTIKVIRQCPQHRFVILTKRPHLMFEYFCNYLDDYKPIPNLCLMTSIENQQTADERIRWLLKTPAAIRGVSCEPLLGEIDLTTIPVGGWPQTDALHGTIGSDCQIDITPKLDWVIVGAESGHNARHCDIDWIRGIVNQCEYAKIPAFVKQIHLPKYKTINDADYINGFELSKDINAWPPSLQIRQMPEGLRQ